jgi:plastocyanin
MRLRRMVMFCIVAALGAATVVLPSIASSETPPTISAYSYKYLSEEARYWQPATAHIGEGGSVKFTNPYSTLSHGLEFTGGPAKPLCTGLPAGAGELTGATSWQGECSFSAPGTYTFICTVHPLSMTGSVIVSAAGTTTTTGTTSTGTTGSGTPPPSEQLNVGPGATAQLLTGTTAAAVKVTPSQRGHSVRGSVSLAPAAAGGTLKVELLGTLGGRQGVLVGRLSHPALSAGRVSFVVLLNARARHALHLRGHLKLRLRVRIASSGGAVVTLTRAVTLHS